MASITGSIPLTNFIAPNSSADSYPITKPIYGLGGLRTVGNTGERDAITSARREAGMVVYVADIQKYYTFKGPTGNGDWTELVLGSSAGVQSFNGATGAITVVPVGDISSGSPFYLGITYTTDNLYPFFNKYTITNNGVRNLNGLTGTVGLSAGTGITFSISANTLTIISTVSGVTGPKGLDGDKYATSSTSSIVLESLTAGSALSIGVTSGLAYTKAQTIIVAGSTSQYFTATIATYSGATLSLSVLGRTGSGTLALWDVNLAGAVGEAGDPGPIGPTGPTGSSGITGPYVISVNGETGTVQNVAKTNTTNTFDLTQTFSNGFQSSQDIFVQNIGFGRGGSGGATNLTIGNNANSVQTSAALRNFAIGTDALASNIAGESNLAIGNSTLISVTAASFDVAIGNNALKNILANSDNNLAIGYNAGAARGLSNIFPLTAVNNSTFIGNNARPLSNNGINELVIGYNALGLGSNTTVIGNTSITNARIYGLLDLPNGISASNIINSINGLTGTVGFSAGTGITLTTSGNTLIISATAVSGITSGVQSINGLTGIIGLSAGTGITFSISGNTLTIISTVTGSCGGACAGVQSFNGATGAITVVPVGDISSGFPTGLGITYTTDNLYPFFNKYTITNTGVRVLTGLTGISLNGSSGSVTITNTGVQTLTGSTGISLTGPTGAVTLLNTGVYKLSASTGINLSGSTGDVTISNSGVLSINSGETGNVLNVPKTSSANTFTQNQTITAKLPKLIIRSTDAPNNTFSVESNLISFSNSAGSTQSWFPGVGSTISFPASSGTLALTSSTISGLNGLTGTVGLSAGTGITLTTSGNTLTISATAVSGITSAVLSIRGLTGIVGLSAGSGITLSTSGNNLTISATAVSGGSGDGSAIISRLYPRLPENGLCAGDIISYNGTDRWFPTPRTYLTTPSIWQTRKTKTNGYPTSSLVIPGAGTLQIQGATAVVGELIQLSLSGDDSGGTTLGIGTWWLNYSVYGRLGSTDPRLFFGSYSGLTILNSPNFYSAISLGGADRDVAGFAMLIRGTTYNAYDGRGGPYGNTLCTASPNAMPLGDNSVCDGDGVEGYPVTCTPRYGYGFTYGGEFYECVNV